MAREARHAPCRKPVLDMIASAPRKRFNGGGYPTRPARHSDTLSMPVSPPSPTATTPITSQRVYAQPIHSCRWPSRKCMSGAASTSSPNLIDAFIQSVGVYPTGTLVELSSGAVGIVIRENPGKRLRPQVLVVLDSVKNEYQRFKELDLAQPQDPGGTPIEILKTLEPGAYGLDPEALYL